MRAPAPSSRTGARRGRGFEMVLIAVYGIFAISATARSLVQIMRDFDFAPVAYSLSLLAAVTYIAVTVALVGRGRRTAIARVLCLVELVGVVVVGTMSLALPELFPDGTVWGGFGMDYGLVPLLLPMVALFYISRTSRKGPTD